MPPKRARRPAPATVSDHFRLVFEYLDLEDEQACFHVCRDWMAEVKRRHPQLSRLHELNKYQKATLHNLKGNRLRNVIAATDRTCVLCQKSYRGGINPDFGVTAHAACVKKRLTDIESLQGYRVIRERVLMHVPSCEVTGWRGRFMYRAIWSKLHPAVPRLWTVQGRLEQHASTLKRGVIVAADHA